MRITVHNTSELYSQGRNGPAKTVSVELSDKSGFLTLQPITSRGEPQNCFIELDVPAMIELAINFLHQEGYVRDFDRESVLEELEYRKKKGRI